MPFFKKAKEKPFSSNSFVVVSLKDRQQKPQQKPQQQQQPQQQKQQQQPQKLPKQIKITSQNKQPPPSLPLEITNDPHSHTDYHVSHLLLAPVMSLLTKKNEKISQEVIFSFVKALHYFFYCEGRGGEGGRGGGGGVRRRRKEGGGVEEERMRVGKVGRGKEKEKETEKKEKEKEGGEENGEGGGNNHLSYEHCPFFTMDENGDLIYHSTEHEFFDEGILLAGLMYEKLIGRCDNVLLDKMILSVTEFSNLDVGWVNTVLQSAMAPSHVLYRPHTEYPSAFSYPLPSPKNPKKGLKILLFSDWGTGSIQSRALLRKAVEIVGEPDMFIHLGDVYYSGTKSEYKKRFTGPLLDQFGNHDYYSGGEGFYDSLDKFRSLGLSPQEGSYFSLSNDDFLILGMDTGFHDRDPIATARGSAMTKLRKNEATFHQEKLKKEKEGGEEKRKVIFLSHHMLFSATDAVGWKEEEEEEGSEGGGGEGEGGWKRGRKRREISPVNTNLLRDFEEYLEDVSLWFWGHEHNMVVYEEFKGLKRGRLIGAGGVPVLVSSPHHCYSTPSSSASSPSLLSSIPSSSSFSSSLPSPFSSSSTPSIQQIPSHSASFSLKNDGLIVNIGFAILTLGGEEEEKGKEGEGGERRGKVEYYQMGRGGKGFKVERSFVEWF